MPVATTIESTITAEPTMEWAGVWRQGIRDAVGVATINKASQRVIDYLLNELSKWSLPHDQGGYRPHDNH